MIRKIFWVITLLIISECLVYCQTDSSRFDNYHNKRFIPRLGFGYEKYGYFEFGFIRQYLSYDYDKVRKCYEGLYFGSYIANELIINNSRLIFGPKVGVEGNIYGGSWGGPLGLEFTNYMNSTKSNFTITPRIFIPLSKRGVPFLMFSYGYNIFTTNDFRDLIGKHRFSLILNLNFKDYHNINALQ